MGQPPPKMRTDDTPLIPDEKHRIDILIVREDEPAVCQQTQDLQHGIGWLVRPACHHDIEPLTPELPEESRLPGEAPHSAGENHRSREFWKNGFFALKDRPRDLGHPSTDGLDNLLGVTVGTSEDNQTPLKPGNLGVRCEKDGKEPPHGFPPRISR